MRFAKQVSILFFAAWTTVPSLAAAQSGFDFPHKTDFLTAGCFTHVIPGLDPAEREDCISRITDRGYTHIYLYAYNEDDYGGPNFDYYTNVTGFVDLLKEVTDAGLKPVVWLNPDDAIINRRRTVAELNARMDDLVPVIDPYVSSYVLGLELNEYWSESKIDALGQHLNTITNKKIAVHETRGRWELCKLAWCDYMMLQYGFGKTAEQIKTITGQAIDDLNKPVVAGEYSKDDEAVSIALGDAAVSVGARGFGNGGTPGDTVDEPSAEDGWDPRPRRSSRWISAWQRR